MAPAARVLGRLGWERMADSSTRRIWISPQWGWTGLASVTLTGGALEDRWLGMRVRIDCKVVDHVRVARPPGAWPGIGILIEATTGELVHLRGLMVDVIVPSSKSQHQKLEQYAREILHACRAEATG